MYSNETDQTTKCPQTSEARGRMAPFNAHNGIILCKKIIVRKVLARGQEEVHLFNICVSFFIKKKPF